MPVNAMILAAGRGERLRPLTDRLPKTLVEVAGISLLERHLLRLAAAGVEQVVINLGWQGEQIVERIGTGAAFGLAVAYSPEYEQILETGGGVRRALPMLGDEPFWVLNGDVYCDYELRPITLADDALGHLVLVETPDYRMRGDFDLSQGRVANGEARYTFSGIACYRPAFFADRPLARFPLGPMLHEAAADGALSGEVHAGHWTDVGTPERLAELNRTLAEAASGG